MPAESHDDRTERERGRTASGPVSRTTVGSRLKPNPSTNASRAGTIVTADRIDRDHAQLAQEVFEPPHGPRKIQRDGVEPQVLADQVGTDQEHEDHREEELDVEELAECQGPERRAITSGAGLELLGEVLEEEQERRQEAGLLLEQSPRWPGKVSTARAGRPPRIRPSGPSGS